MHFRFGKWFDHEGNEVTVGEAPVETPAEQSEQETGRHTANDPREQDATVPDQREGMAPQ